MHSSHMINVDMTITEYLIYMYITFCFTMSVILFCNMSMQMQRLQ